MKLEQTIQRCKKSARSIIGQARQNVFASEWELVFHKMLATCNCFSGITKLGKLYDSDLNLHHELSGGYSELFTESVQNVMTFVNENGNPFKLETSLSSYLTLQQSR